jgi:hypothetical protein
MSKALARNLLRFTMKYRHSIHTVVAVACAAAVLGACDLGSQNPQDRSGNEMRSSGTGERNERLGNDPAEQNTGRGSVDDDERPR